MPTQPAFVDLAGLNGTNGFRVKGADSEDGSGFAVALGDVNGDGYADLVIGAPYADKVPTPGPRQVERGMTYVVYGSAGGLPADINLASIDGSNGFNLSGKFSSDLSGRYVAAGADIDGDGVDDLAVSGNSGQALVEFGRAANFPPNIDLGPLPGGFKLGQEDYFKPKTLAFAGDLNGDGIGDLMVGDLAKRDASSPGGMIYVVYGRTSPFPGILTPASLNGANGFRIHSAELYSAAGYSVSGAGDVNGDGFADLIIGAPNADRNGYSDPVGRNAGAAYVVFGSASGAPADIYLADLDGTNGFRLVGVATDNSAGRSVGSAGDVNGDGFDDVIVGAIGTGGSYVVFGKASGFAPNLDLATLNGSNGFKVAANGFSVASAGDVNGDGFADVIVGARYVIFGKATGFAANFDPSTLDGTNGFQVSTGPLVAASGDVNGDGLDDLAFGDSLAGANGVRSGATYVVYGLLPDTAVTRTGTAASQHLVGGGFADVLSGLGGEDHLYGNGGADSLDGGQGNDVLDGGAGDDRLAGGTGTDTASYIHAAAGVTVNLGLSTPQATGGAGIDQLLSIENLVGSDFGDTLKGGIGVNLLQGGRGDDSLDGGPGADVMQGGAGDDVYYLDDAGDRVVERAGEGNDTVVAGFTYALSGMVENLILRYGGAASGLGNELDNHITGNTAGNLLDGRGGADVLTGGGGGDTFKLNSILDSTNAAPDLIADFTSGDRLDLHAVDADPNTSGDQAFHLGATPGHVGDLVLSYDAAHARTVLQLYVNADANPDATIWLSGDHLSMGAGDFVF